MDKLTPESGRPVAINQAPESLTQALRGCLGLGLGGRGQGGGGGQPNDSPLEADQRHILRVPPRTRLPPTLQLGISARTKPLRTEPCF